MNLLTNNVYCVHKYNLKCIYNFQILQTMIRHHRNSRKGNGKCIIKHNNYNLIKPSVKMHILDINKVTTKTIYILI